MLKKNKFPISQSRKFKSVLNLPGKVISTDIEESTAKKEIYKRIINRCCIPDCERKGYTFHLHHIIPRKKNGKDEFINYLCVCDYCHRHTKLHSRSEDKQLELCVYKFWIENELLGFTSDDYDDQEFWLLLKKWENENQNKKKIQNQTQIKIRQLTAAINSRIKKVRLQDEARIQ